MSNQRRQRPFARRNDTPGPGAHEVEAIGNELRALPEWEAPGELWDRVRDRLERETKGDDSPSRRPLHHSPVPVALAAGVALIALAAVLVSVNLTTNNVPPVDGTGFAGERGIVPPAAVDADPRAGNESLDHATVIEALMERSRLAEKRRREVLAFYSPSGPEGLLREHIGGIDATLNEQMFTGEIEPQTRQALLRDRVELMANLTDIERYRQHEFVRQVSF